MIPSRICAARLSLTGTHLAAAMPTPMCQLLGMNSSKPAHAGFSFEGFAERGGRTGEHRDGWGIACHTADGCRLITDHLASVDSPLALSVKQNPLKANNVVAHIRKATQGRIALENSHPFTRRLWGRTWSFAHNGDLKAFDADIDERFAPAGDTDSEAAFCHLLCGLRRRFGETEPPRQALFATLKSMAADIAAHGSFNFLLSDGVALYAHCSTLLHYVVRQYPFSVAHLVDCERSIDFSTTNHRDDRMSVIATAPLTRNEQWIAFLPGELKVFIDGQPVAVQAASAVTVPAHRQALSFAMC
jgi:glutamine amidotransferase